MDIKIVLTNFSAVDWSGHTTWDIDDKLDTVKQSPGNTLDKYSGREVLWIVRETLSWYVDGHSKCSTMWSTNNGSELFGVSVYAPFQFLTMGAAPNWGYGMKDAHGKWGWTDQAADQSSPFTITTSSGHTVRIQPTCAHSSIALDVQIS